MNYGSLYSGIGGLDLAVEHTLGATCAWQCEQDPFRRAVLERHWPGVTRFVEAQAAASTATAVDLVCGGFVCKDISAAGPRKGLDGQRSGDTWLYFRDVIAAQRPSFAFIENSPRLAGAGLDRILRELAALGHDVRWTTLRASDLGAPHQRDRIWILSYADSERLRQLAERVERIAAIRRHAESVDDGARGDVSDAAVFGCEERTDEAAQERPAASRRDPTLRPDWPPAKARRRRHPKALGRVARSKPWL